MGVSTTTVVLMSIFLIIGMLLPGIIWPPGGSLEAWKVQESSFPLNGSSGDKAAFLLGYAILAPSIYNTQPWKFNISGDEIRIYADESRWLKNADSSKREMYISIGRAIENLVIAADHFGYNSTVSYFPGSNDTVALVKLRSGHQAAPSMDPRLFSAITSSQRNVSQIENASHDYVTNHAISSEAARALGRSQDQNIQVFLVDDPDTKKRFLDLTVRADKLLYSDVNYKSELGHWISQGGMGATGSSAKIDQIKIAFLDSVPGQIEKDAEIINNSIYLGFITSKENNTESQVRAGQVIQRIGLMSSSYGLSLYPMGQSLQAASTYSDVAGLLEAEAANANGSSVQQAFCLIPEGRENKMTPRRPLEEVMI